MSTEIELKSEWLDARRDFSTGTTRAAICRLSPWKSPYEQWAEMVLKISKPFSSEAAYWGTELEAIVMKVYARKTGRSITETHSRWEDLTSDDCVVKGYQHEELRDDILVQTMKLMLFSKEHAHLACTPDFLIVEYVCTPSRIDLGFEGPGMGDCKTTNARAEKEWTEDGWKAALLETPDTPLREHLLSLDLGENWMPPHIYCQLQHNIEIAGLSWGSIAVLFGGQKFSWRDVARDDEFLRLSGDEVLNFVTVYLEGEKSVDGPPLTGLASETETLKEIYPGVATDQEIHLGTEYSHLEERKREIAKEAGVLKKEIDRITNTLKGAMGECNFATLEGSDRYLKRAHVFRRASEASEYVTMKSMKLSARK